MLTFQQSRDHCKRLESTADSISIPDRQTNDFIESIVPRSIAVWTSGCRIAGRWVWGDGSSINYFNWNRGEPNNQGKEEFLETRSGRWNNLIGSYKLCTVCQYHLGADYVGGGGGGGVSRPTRSKLKCCKVK